MSNEKEKALNAAHAILRKLEKKRKSRIFVYVEADDSHICFPQRNWVFAQKDAFKNVDKLEVLLHSSGGHAEFAYQIAKLFRRRCSELNVVVPLMAKSAATLMCLSADQIFMGERSELGPLDVQIMDPIERGMHQFSPVDEFKSMEYLKEYSITLLDYYALALVERSGMSLRDAFHEAIPAVTSLMAPLYKKVDPSKIGSYRRSLAVAEEYAKRLLQIRGSAHTEGIVDSLVWKYPSHDFVIDRFEANKLGLPVAHLDEDEDDQFFDVILNIFQYGESVYEFTKPAPGRKGAKKKPTKRNGGGRVSSSSSKSTKS